jgi:hypothetical protein
MVCWESIMRMSCCAPLLWMLWMHGCCCVSVSCRRVTHALTRSVTITISVTITCLIRADLGQLLCGTRSLATEPSACMKLGWLLLTRASGAIPCGYCQREVHRLAWVQQRARGCITCWCSNRVRHTWLRCACTCPGALIIIDRVYLGTDKHMLWKEWLLKC